MSTNSKRNLPFDDEPEYTFGKSIDSATPAEWNTVAAKLYHPSDATPAGFKPDEYTISEGGVKTWTKESCPVENPAHYNTGSIEAIEGIEASMSPEEFKGYLKGNMMKYAWRYDYKGNPVEDLRKAKWYLERLIEANL